MVVDMCDSQHGHKDNIVETTLCLPKNNKASSNMILEAAVLKDKSKRGSEGASPETESNVSELMQRLKLTSEEADVVILDYENEENLLCLEWALIGKVLSGRRSYLAENFGAQYFQVASDCLSVIKKLQQQGLDRSSTGAIVHDIKLRATKFASCTFKHVYRSCNEAAHVLAKTAEHDQESCWFNEPPDVIKAIICTEQLFE